MAAPLYTTDSGLLFHAGKILVVTVGLPARGKTHVSRALERYLRWMGVKTQVISLGDYRRKTLGGAQQLPPDYFTLGEKTPETMRLRESVREGCEGLIWKFFETGGQVVIYDANNGTRRARKDLAEKFDKAGIHVILLESTCDNEEIVKANIRSVKISSPDYKGWDEEKAIEDYYRRIHDHEKYYEPVEETDWPFIRIFNVGDRIEINKIQGYLQSRIIFFLMNIHNKPRTIYFARSGQSLIEHSYKADSDLSPAGWEYAERLKDFVIQRRKKTLEERGIDASESRLVIWTSARRRAHHTAWPFLTHASNPPANLNPTVAASAPGSSTNSPLLGALQTSASSTSLYSPSLYPQKLQVPRVPHLMLPPSTLSPALALLPPQQQQQLLSAPQTQVITQPPTPPPPQPIKVKVIEKPQMSEINPGVWDGLSPDEARRLYPEEWERFLKDPYAFRAPRAESYHDLCVRLEPILVELEREQEDLLIIGHASVIRCLLSYLIGLPASEIPAIEVARGDLLEVRPASYGVHSQNLHFWDGPGRRGAARTRPSSAAGGATIGTGPGAAGAGGAGRKGEALGLSKLRDLELDDSGLTGEGAEGEAAVFEDAMDVPPEEGGADVDNGASGDATEDDEAGNPNNYYENYAEDTRGKRKAGMSALGLSI
ncbi:6PF2K-domain-containing protein [Schizopora paradoxa]|uniref:6PF2K-domain-containing protein n=1 Tax=Schizopora paradoxa TaxID=27342 RepID=A0A0H2RRZ3_9AGAM|nr:6PF2K-domain-containing protein [Schizopora paradoxa]